MSLESPIGPLAYLMEKALVYHDDLGMRAVARLCLHLNISSEDLAAHLIKDLSTVEKSSPGDAALLAACFLHGLDGFMATAVAETAIDKAKGV
jgi:hypothetical protein